MPAFGENLRREREMRGVALEEIAAATKINLRFLEALESEDFSGLPGGIFARSFVRAYAKYLGLDEEHTLAEYYLAARPQADIDLNHLTVSKSASQRGSSSAAVVGLLVAAAMLSGSYLLYRYARPAQSQKKPINSDQVSAATTSAPMAPPSMETTAPAITSAGPPTDTTAASGSGVASANKGTQYAAGSLPAPPTPAPILHTGKTGQDRGDLILQIAATEEAWVAVSADGKTTLQRILQPREFKTLKAREFFDVVTGNAHGIILTLNGQTLRPLGGRNAYRKIHLTHEGLKNLAP